MDIRQLFYKHACEASHLLLSFLPSSFPSPPVFLIHHSFALSTQLILFCLILSFLTIPLFSPLSYWSFSPAFFSNRFFPPAPLPPHSLQIFPGRSLGSNGSPEVHFYVSNSPLSLSLHGPVKTDGLPPFVLLPLLTAFPSPSSLLSSLPPFFSPPSLTPPYPYTPLPSSSSPLLSPPSSIMTLLPHLLSSSPTSHFNYSLPLTPFLSSFPLFNYFFLYLSFFPFSSTLLFLITPALLSHLTLPHLLISLFYFLISSSSFSCFFSFLSQSLLSSPFPPRNPTLPFLF